MDPLRCTRLLQSLRRVSGSVVHLKRAIVGTYCQRRGISDGAQEEKGIETAKTSRPFSETRDEKPLAPYKRPKIESGAKTRSAHFTIKPSKEPYTDVEYVTIEGFSSFHPAFLRDACTCEKCVDPSSKQKNFQTTDIPKNIRAGSVNKSPEGVVEIVWENDIPGWDPGHMSVFPQEFFKAHSSPSALLKSRFEAGRLRLWNKKRIARELEYVNYDEYMGTDESLFRAVRQLRLHGLLLIRGVPESEKSVEEIAMRIGNLRDTFYGRTWDVKSVPEAKNVAYTAQYLGLHMDLLYMADPPGFQFLHCLQNSCEGGSSLFSDAFYAASRLSPDAFYNLSRMTVAYHYRNAGEHYYFRHPIIDVPVTALETLNRHSWSERINFINYSPPFQANHVATGQAQQSSFPALLDSMRKFASLVEDEKNLYQYRLQEGECVIFNNRRVLHGRRQFDTSAGSRWLKGAYIDTDVFMSKYRVLSEKFAGSGLEHLSFEGKRLVSPPDAA